MSENGQGKPEENDQLISVSLGVIFLVLPFVIFAYVLAFHDLPFGGPETWATFGDYFSGIMTPVAAVVSVAILCRTLVIQQREMKNTVNELKRAAQINENNLKQQHRSFKLDEFSGSLEKVRELINNHYINLVEQSILDEVGSPLNPYESRPQAGCAFSYFVSVIDRGGIEKYSEWIGKSNDLRLFPDSFRELNRYIEILIDYLRIGGLYVIITDDVVYLKKAAERIRPILDATRIRGEAATFLDSVRRLNNVFEESRFINREEVDSLCQFLARQEKAAETATIPKE